MTITTKFLGPTNHRGARIKVTTSFGTTRTYSYDYASSDPHVGAVQRWIDEYNATAEMEWRRIDFNVIDWRVGEAPRGFVFVNGVLR